MSNDRSSVGEHTVLVTGASGRIGRVLRRGLARPGRALRLLDVVPPAPPCDDEDGERGEDGEDGERGGRVDLVTASVTDLDAVRAACRGVAAVVHLGGLSSEAPWEEILETNVHGTRNVLEAARLEKVPRLVLASSHHAAGFWSRDEAPPAGLPADAAPRPDTYYGMSKAAMESLGSLFHARFGIDVICLRIGGCSERPGSTRALATWLSYPDAVRLAEAALTAPDPGFRLVWGISRNTRRWWSLAAGAEIGYHPSDDAERFAASLIAEHGEPNLTAGDHRFVGGPFCTNPLGEAWRRRRGPAVSPGP